MSNDEQPDGQAGRDSSNGKGRGKGKRNFLSENKSNPKSQSTLTLEEELRVRTLTLEGEEGDVYVDQLSRDGFLQSETERLAKIDAELEALAAQDHTGLSRVMQGYLEKPEADAEAHAVGGTRAASWGRRPFVRLGVAGVGDALCMGAERAG